MNRPLFAFLFVLLAALPATAAPIALSGRAVDADGEPLAEAAVRLVPILGLYASGEREPCALLGAQASRLPCWERRRLACILPQPTGRSR